jgi:Zn-dependent protease
MPRDVQEAAVFRPPLRGAGGNVLLGAAAGSMVGLFFAIPAILAAAFGAVAAAIAIATRHARGLRVVADEGGLRVLDGGAPVDVAWGELRLGFGLTQRQDGTIQRYAIVADRQGRSFAFGETGGRGCGTVQGADGRNVEVTDLRDAPLLLAVIIQRAGAWGAFPESLRELGAAVAGPEPAGGPPSRTLPPADEAPARAPRRAGAGLVGLVAKLGSKVAATIGKVGTGALKAAKTANVGWAVASAAAYSILFSWKFALAIMVQLFVHEYGHVHAMRRTGMKVRGMYFIPLLGAVAVTDEAFKTRRQQVYVALNGPLWGSLLAVIPAALWFWTGDALWATIAAWWALINLFNLLPIAPLDGGRVMQAFAFSYSSSLGLALSLAGLVGALALGTAAGFSLIWFVAALGAMELVSESQVHAGARALRLLPESGRFRAPHWLFLRGAVAPVSGPGGTGDVLFLRSLERQERAARAAPLRKWELVRWGLAYAGLALALVAIVWFLRHVPGADLASRILE